MYSEDGYMDTSENYIAMCESAKDIQLQWNFKIEDYIFDPAEGEASVKSTIKCRNIFIG
jgi:hypothetical protein